MFSWFKQNSESAVIATKKPAVKSTVKPPVKKAASWKPVDTETRYADVEGRYQRVTQGLTGSKKGLDDYPTDPGTGDTTTPDPQQGSTGTIDLPVINSDPTSNDQVADELGKFQRRLTVKVFTLEKILEDLEQKKLDLMAGVQGDAAKYDLEHECPNAKLKKLSAKIFHVIKECIEPAEEEVEDLLNEIRPHLYELSAHVAALCDVLNEPLDKVDAGHHKTDEEKRKVALEICDSCIELGTELKDFLSHVLSELDMCLQSEKIGEIALNLVVQFAIFLATSKTLGFNLTFTQPYRNSLNERIEKEKIEIEIFETDGTGTLKRALKTIEQLNAGLQSQQTAKASESGMFAAKKDPAQVDAVVPAPEALAPRATV